MHEAKMRGEKEVTIWGTGSPRRIMQLRALRPDLKFVALRGNVDTRLRKLAGGEFEAILLATAGLNRLGRTDRAAVARAFDEQDAAVPWVAQQILVAEQ